MNRIHFLLALALALPVSAENWPRFRGPTGQGHSTETNLPLHWSATSNVVWKTPIAGEGWSSPIVWGNRVFLTTTLERGTKCHVLCVDTAQGKIRWDQQVFEQVPLRKEGKNSYATPTPCTDGERVYAVFGDGGVAALTLDGSVVWTNREVQFYSRHGLGASPIVHGGRVIMAYDGSNRVKEAGSYPNNSDEERLGWQIPWDKSFLAALDTKTGQRLWTGRRAQSRIAHATPILFRMHNEDQILSIAGDVVQAFRFETGQRLWSIASQGEGLVPSPVMGNGLIFASSGFEKTTLRGIRPGDREERRVPEIVWEQRKGVPTQASLVYAGTNLFAVTDGGIASCFNPANGDILWQERVGGNYSASPVVAEGRIYFLNEAGETTVIAAAPEFKVLAKNALGEKCQASMAVSGGRLFFRTDKNLFCIAQTP
jgi:outer membrane protein assembly factor BamB